jgi:endonuclease/exonuclease/phosphatase family metal-dependent hydrolase
MNKQFSVMTYNVCHCRDYSSAKDADFWHRPEVADVQKTAGVLSSISADIVGLNEIYDAPSGVLHAQAKHLAEFAKYPSWVFGRAISLGKNNDLDYGNALLTKFQVLSNETILVPSPDIHQRRQEEQGYYEDRAIMKAVVDVGVPVSVFVTHFGLNGLEQEWMVERLTTLIDNETNPVLLLGDFNCEPNSEVLAPIFERLTSAAMVHKNKQKTFATYQESVQIDYIFASKHFRIDAFERVEANVSDHYPCLAILTLEI